MNQEIDLPTPLSPSQQAFESLGFSFRDRVPGEQGREETDSFPSVSAKLPDGWTIGSEERTPALPAGGPRQVLTPIFNENGQRVAEITTIFDPVDGPFRATYLIPTAES